MHFRYWLLIALLLPLQVFAEALGKITFAEGKVRVIRDTSLVPGSQGMAVEATDILETSKPGFALVEFPDGTVIALGDATRVMLSRTAGASSLLLLEGWLKVQSHLADNASSYVVSSPVQSSSVKSASLIVHGSAASGEVFVESGTATVGITDKQGRPANMASAKSGQYVTRAADRAAALQPRPSEAFLSSMPTAFRDALPARLERFKERNVEAKASGVVSYADVADWLGASTSWRTGFVKRFEPRLSDAAFRQQLESRLKSHPEWERVLHPPKSAQ